ncbi:site-specific integrase [uncultured Flavobacterium sp.]|uniref:site-specific integrase n=1 Tax=uncultured Flavobacterium sp. TaxID=165435 RepID=UPI0025EE645C|nr:site-specific integrase [uncultured Flavobacterium sp.]
MKPTNFAQYISSFIRDYLSIEREYSPNTIKSYTGSFILLLKFIVEQKKIRLEKITIEHLSKEMILEFLNWLKLSRNSSSSSINNRLAAIHSFFKYLSREELAYLIHSQSVLSISFRREIKTTINYLSPEALKLLLSMPNLKNKKGRRDLALLSLIYDTGARVQEVIDITPSMINMQKPMTIRVMGKGKRMRVIPVSKLQLDHLKIYMQENDLFNPSRNLYPLFFNSRGDKLTRAGVNYILKFYLKKASIIEPSFYPKKVSCHTFRHSKAMHLLQANVSLVYIRDILGHASVITTEIYAKTDSKQKRDALEKAYVNLTPNPSKSNWEGNKNLIEWLQGF